MKSWSDVMAFSSRSPESETVEYLERNIRILIQVSPYSEEYGSDWAPEGETGLDTTNVRSKLGSRRYTMDQPERVAGIDATTFALEGDDSDEAVKADADSSIPSEPIGWFQYHESLDGPLASCILANPDRVAIDGMPERYAQGYYAIVEDAFVAVHVVSSVEPEIMTEEVMDLMREKLAADPPEARFERTDVSD